MTPNNALELYTSKIILSLQEKIIKSNKASSGKRIWKDFLRFMYANDKELYTAKLDWLKNISDDAFMKFIKNDIHIQITHFKEPKLKDISKCAEFFNIELDEHIVVPSNGNVITKSKVACGYHNVKFLVQIIDKKHAFNHKTTDINAETGLLTATAKVTQFSLNEATGLYTYGIADELLPELFGSRADNLDAKYQLEEKIIKDGAVSQKDISSSGEGRTSQTISNFFTSAGYKNTFTSDVKVRVDGNLQDSRL